MANTRRTPAIRGRHHRAQMTLLMLLADLVGFGGALGLVLLANQLVHFMAVNLRDAEYLIIPLICLALFMSSRLYPCVGVNPADEIKMVTQFTAASFAAGLLCFSLWVPGWKSNIPALAALWALSVICLLLSRWSLRIAAVRLGLWGEPVVVMGRSEKVDRTIRYFLERRRLGYVPAVAVFDALGAQTLTCPVPVIEHSSLLNSEADRFVRQGIETVILDFSDITGMAESGSMKKLQSLFRRVIFLSDADWLAGPSIRIQDFEGLVGISAQRNVLSPIDRLFKRGLDILGSLVMGVILVPLWLALAILIKLDSAGPALYSQERIGRGGRTFKMYKFRSMSSNAESALEAILRSNTEPRRQWEQNQKLRDDPRITRIGRFLRKYSLDEFPQLLNVLKGDMSLVGPRPIIDAEAPRYADKIGLYTSTRPGMTGLWQVSGRNNTGYEERVGYDAHYVRHWSLWLDFYILLRTPWVVLHRDGAY